MIAGRSSSRWRWGIALGASVVLVTGCQTILGINPDRPLAADTTDGGTPPGLPDASSGADHSATADANLADVVVPLDTDASLTITADVANARADEAVEAMLLNFWDPASEALYATSLEGSAAVADLTSFTQAWDAVIDAAERHALPATATDPNPRFLGTVQTLFNSQAALGVDSTTNSTIAFDQELYLILAMIRAADVTKNSAYLLTARNLFTDIQNNAWDTTCCTIAPKVPFGGIWKDRAHTKKTTAANAAAVIAAARLAERTTGSAADSYYGFAGRVYDYWSQYMVAPSGQVYDSVSPSSGADAAAAGVDTTTGFTYDQGLMIGAAVEFGQATQAVDDASATTFALAESMAGYLLTTYTTTATVPAGDGTNAGPILSDGDDGACLGTCALYKGYAARYLGELALADSSHPEYAAILERSADAAYSIARDPGSHLYNADWASAFPSGGSAVLGATSSAAMVLSAVASLAGPPAAPTNPASYEAAEAVLQSVALQSTLSGFTGWGYVSSPGTAQPGVTEGVTFPITVPMTDLYALSFFYDFQTTNNVARDVLVNGGSARATTFAALAQPGSWASPPQVMVSVALAAGANTVAVVYDPSNGSYGALDLDELQWSENLMAAQPGATDWGNSSPPAPMIAPATSPANATTWTGTITVGSTGAWIGISPTAAPFNATLQANQKYVAAITLTGSSTPPYYLDVNNGATDSASSQVTLSATPQTLQTPVFSVAAGAQVQFQLRVPYSSSNTAPIDVNVTMSALGIYLVPSPSP